ncbi:MAG TPA: IclR family transcriptional regulator [Synergistales bacterium]|nr:IclR family transcriptional regulator [Synergistales bacterium]
MKKDNYVQSVIRALEIIEILNERKELGITEIALSLDLDKSTVHRLINTLRHKGYVKQNILNQKYSNTFKLFEMGTLEVDRTGLIRRVNPFLEHLAHQTRETVNLAILEGKFTIYVDKRESSEVIRADLGVGRRYPAYSTSLGKAILAFLPEEKVIELFRDEKFVSFTSNTISSLDELLAQLKLIRRRGYAYDNEELINGLACVAGAIRNYDGSPLAAISVAFPRYRYQKGSPEEERIISLVLDITRKLSMEFGFMS